MARERAWDAKGKWCGEGPPAPRPELDVPHECGHPIRAAGELCAAAASLPAVVPGHRR